MRTTAQESAARAEFASTSEPDDAEQFAGYAVMGVPFSTGHYLAFRRFPASSIGPGYQAVWLRTPDGQWTIHADAPPELSCARYFGKALKEARQTPVLTAWTSPWNLTVTVPGAVSWELEMKRSWTTTAATAVAQHMPAPLWHKDGVLKLMGRLMGPALGTGSMNFTGHVPNGQSFQAKPLRVWSVSGSRANIGGLDAGTPQALAVQDRLEDFWLPQRGLFIAELSVRFPSTTAAASMAPSPKAMHTHPEQESRAS